MYYYWYKLLLINDIYKVLTFTFKAYCYSHHVKIDISVKCLGNSGESPIYEFKFFFGFCFLTIIFPYVQPLLMSMRIL